MEGLGFGVWGLESPSRIQVRGVGRHLAGLEVPDESSR